MVQLFAIIFYCIQQLQKLFDFIIHFTRFLNIINLQQNISNQQQSYSLFSIYIFKLYKINFHYKINTCASINILYIVQNN